MDKYRFLSFCSAAAMAAALPAHAQDAAADAPAGGIQDIVVTAQKRAQNLQDVPIAVSAVSAQTLGSMQVTTLQALQGSVPNAQIENFSNAPNTAVFTIRGIGVIEPDPYAGNTVSIVVDGVPQFFSMGALLDMYDVERVEILRGPQGTLFGANTTGGVVNVATARPTGEFGGYAKVNVGNWGRFDASGSIEMPIVTDKLSLKVAGIHTERNGWTTNIWNGEDMGSKNIDAVRGILHATPTPDLSITLQGEYVAARNGAPIVINGGQAGEANHVPAGTFWNGAVLPMYASPCAVPGERCVAPKKYYSGNNEVPDQSDMDTYFTVLTVEAKNTPLGDITSISGYKKFKLFEYTDQDGTSKTNNATRRRTEAWQFSQELRTNIDIGDRFNMILGGFYMKTHYDHYQMYHLDFALPGLAQFNTQDQDTESFSAFAQSYTRLTDKLTFQAGIRYTHDKIDARATLDNAMNLPALTAPGWDGGLNDPATVHQIDTGGKRSWNNVGWKLGLDYQVDTNKLLYASWARGFKSGGFTGRIGVLEDGNEPFNPEKVDTFEAGMKLDLFDRRLRANFAAFYTNYRNMQVAQIYYDPDTQVQGNRILNAAKSEIKGFELELTAMPATGLTLRGSLGYLDTKYKEFFYFDPVSLAIHDLKGKPLQNAPKWATSLGANYDMEMGDGSRAIFDVSWRYTAKKYYTAILNTPRSTVQPTYLVDTSLTFLPAGERFEITLWGKNILDKRYIASVYDSPGYMGLAAYAPPREYGISGKVKF
ncbi:TonB-dependent receptor [Sphingobium jiangsuense]|uniref:Iron complex outermembrane receptor protein n=1 Tax=Sphingobium jiangsuense TaxID=870476 RepID=A0A7W6BQE9_9SPHN|nr:TonB-dependent receptor [Sphingobium jiangsuense]MBB3926843.1 iron complex outermembrane receptor protein [Sphingobium jiangsuense]GLS98851.1 TonB-dependent receptor [Sphingobium jiangsuense]